MEDFPGAKLQQAMATAASKSVSQTRGHPGVESWSLVVGAAPGGRAASGASRGEMQVFQAMSITYWHSYLSIPVLSDSIEAAPRTSISRVDHDPMRSEILPQS